MRNLALLEDRGRGESRVLAAPMASRGSTRGSHHRFDRAKPDLPRALRRWRPRGPDRSV